MKRTAPLTLPLVLLLAACGAETAAEPIAARRIPIEVGSSSYNPAEVTARVGEAITLVVTRTSEQGCGDVLVIPSENVRRDLPLNEAVEVTLTPTAAGTLRFTCGMDMFDGAIVVTD